MYVSVDLKYCNDLQLDTLYLNFLSFLPRELDSDHNVTKLTHRYWKIEKIIGIVASTKRKSQEKPEPRSWHQKKPNPAPAFL